MHGAGRYGLQCLANLDLLPPTGAIMIAAPLKILQRQRQSIARLSIGASRLSICVCQRGQQIRPDRRSNSAR